jgi:simple sugar transport system substrate-binding protein
MAIAKSSPRHVRLCAVAAAVILSAVIAGCGKTSATDTTSSAPSAGGPTAGGPTAGSPAAGGDAVAVGFIYVGPKDDYGYNQAHADGAAAVRKMDGVKVMEEERVPETADVQKSMQSMIELDGAKLIFPTSFGYFDPHVLVMAKKYPEVMFLHCGGLWNEKVHPKNVGSYFGYIDECQYLSGIVAGHTSKSKKIGFVAAKPIPQVRRNINAFTMGARSVDPSITCIVIFTGDWSMPVKEAEATNSLIDQGVDVVTCHVDSPKVVVETAERRGIYTCGYHCSQATLAPKGYLTGAEWNWEKVYTDYIKMYLSHQKIPNLVRGGLKEQIVKTSPYGPAVSEKAKQAADAVKSKFMAGTFVIYKGELKDNTGKVVIPAGKQYVQTAIELESMNYLVDGVKG